MGWRGETGSGEEGAGRRKRRGRLAPPLSSEEREVESGVSARCHSPHLRLLGCPRALARVTVTYLHISGAQKHQVPSVFLSRPREWER